jgi:hypothetical protein
VEVMMRVAATIIAVCLSIAFLGGGCSDKEEKTTPPQKNRVVKRIKKSIPKQASTLSIPEEVRPDAEEKEAEGSAEVAVLEEEASKGLPPVEGTATGKTETEKVKPLELPEKKTKERELQKTGEGRLYVVQVGETLSSIAMREDVYGDPMRWPILYRHNLDMFKDPELGEGLPDRNLREGMRLRVITPEQAKANVEKRAGKFWVVNVLSATKTKEITPAAIKLVKNGYPVYITRARVRGKDWMRLRVGFFKDKAEANREGKKIVALLKRVEVWINKVEGDELEVFGRY